MSGLIQRLRLLPIVLVAAAGLFVLKVTGIVMDGGYTLGAGHQARQQTAPRTEPAVIVRSDQIKARETARPKSWAQDMFGYPDVTGSVGASDAKPPASASAAEKPASSRAAAPPQASTSGAMVQLDAQISPAERALLERLSERRKELEKRRNELDMRDTLVKAAEKKLEERLSELKLAEERIVAATQHKEEAELQRLKNLVTMYENMKAKDAARIFDRLDIRLATDVAKLIQPRRMSDIMAQMTPDAAQKLTTALASEAQADPHSRSRLQDLPKIEGRPSGS